MSTAAAWIRGRIRGLVRPLTRKLAAKLIVPMASIIALVVGSLTWISYSMLEDMSFRSSMEGTASNLALVGKNLDKYMAEIEQLSLPQLQYDALMTAIQTEADDYAAKIYLDDYLRRLFYSRSDLEGVYLYLIASRKYYYISRQEPDVAVRVRADADGKIPATEWYAEALASKRNRFVQSLLVPSDPGYDVDTNAAYMAYHRVLRRLSDRKAEAVISFFFNPSAVSEIVKDIPLIPGEHVVYVNERNVPFYRDDAAFFDRMAIGGALGRTGATGAGGRFDWRSGGDRYLVVYDRNEASGWKLIKAIPYAEINRAAQTNRNVSLAIGLAFLLAALLLVALASGAITRPLKQLSQKMNRFGEGFFNVEVPVKGQDEIAHLANRFNMMVKRTNDLINERYKMKLAEKNAILKALEAEINPHFLYNALQAISTRALKSGDAAIADMVDALALTLRYCISGKDIVKLREELQHIENYLVLQKARFGDRLQVAYELEEEALDLSVPKLSVQSLVENAIKHALEKVSGRVTIVIRCERKDGGCVLSVADNGPGIPPDRLREIRQMLEAGWEDREGGSIGLQNLGTRLKLIYGEAARLEIRTDEAGTEMRIVLPDGEGRSDG